MDLLPALLLGYTVGSLPIGFLTAHGARGVDLRRVGSGNVGATNVYLVSLGSIAATMVLPAAAWPTPGPRAVDLAATLVAGLILFRHRGNVARLWAGTEGALGT